MPERKVSAKETGAIIPTDERQQLHDRLASALAPLLEAHLGTAVAVRDALNAVPAR